MFRLETRSIFSAAGDAEDAECEDPGTRAQHSGWRMSLQCSPRSFLSVPFGRTFPWCAGSPPTYILRQASDDECERDASVRLGAEDGARGFPLDPVCGCGPHEECICEQGGRHECSTEVETESLRSCRFWSCISSASDEDSILRLECLLLMLQECSILVLPCLERSPLSFSTRLSLSCFVPFESFELLCELNKQIISFLSSPWLRTYMIKKKLGAVEL
jgi:hypothetical protein